MESHRWKKSCRLSHKTVNWEAYHEYLITKREVDILTNPFYLQERWRAWKFRLYCKCRSSENRFFNRLEKTFGPDCKLYYGDWSSSFQQKGCTPVPNKGIRLRSRRGLTHKFRTSKTYNGCLMELRRYAKRGGGGQRLSYSRLFCPMCSSMTGRPSLLTET